jgi:hypothetical protein
MTYLLFCHITSHLEADFNILRVAWAKATAAEEPSDLVSSRVSTLLSSHLISIIYLISQIVTVFIWLLACYFISDIQPTLKYFDSSGQASGIEVKDQSSVTFKCAFEVLVNNRPNNYEVQCVIPPYHTQHFAVSANRALCIVMAILTVGHIINLYFLAPIGQRESISLFLKAMQVEPSKVTVKYGFTNLHLMSVLAGKMYQLGDIPPTLDQCEKIKSNQHNQPVKQLDGQKSNPSSVENVESNL